MTKEEYEQLLKSEYWKGYSYSLIKERNFTCEDCGKSFPNERNKLQVHHLVYRDVNPWQYKPEEVVVLCEECHRKRHGLPGGESSSDEYKRAIGPSSSEGKYDKGSQPHYGKLVKYGYAVFGILLLMFFVRHNWPQSGKTTPVSDSTVTKEVTAPVISVAPQKQEMKRKPIVPSAQKNNTDVQQIEPDEQVKSSVFVEKSLSGQKNDTFGIHEESQESATEIQNEHAAANVSTEGSTLEILDRIQHARIVEEAKEAGVSTEGSTLEILDRIQHARIVEEAKEAGVSTEGSSLEILDRIQHARMVEEAKK